MPLAKQTLKIWSTQKLPKACLEYKTSISNKIDLSKLRFQRNFLKLNPERYKNNVFERLDKYKSNVSDRLHNVDFYRVKSWKREDMKQEGWILLGVAVIGVVAILLYFRYGKNISGTYYIMFNLWYDELTTSLSLR